MKFIWLLLLIVLTLPELVAQTRVPGEWESHDAIWIPLLTMHESSREDSLTIVLISKLAEYVPTVVVVENEAVSKIGKAHLSRFNLDASPMRWVEISPMTMWLRDNGPVFYYEKATADTLRICNFKFTSYQNISGEPVSEHTNHLDAVPEKIGEILGIQVRKSELVLEGGAFEVNGKGTIILVDSLVLKRNPSFSKEQIEMELETDLGIQSFIWLRQGVAQDPQGSRYYGKGIYARGTGGHTDHFVRFANDSTILLHWESDSLHVSDPIRDLNHQRMAENLEILENFADHRGKRFQVLKVPSPGMVYQEKVLNKALRSGLPELSEHEGDTIRISLSASYMNYLITNNLVILPAYNVAADERVRTLFQSLYPGRDIYQINPTPYNQRSGGIHCLTLPQPVRADQ